jgi:hypothetical protein
MVTSYSKIFVLAVILLLNVTLSSTGWGQSLDKFNKGARAFSRGDCVTAEKEWLPLAEKGMDAAQSALVLMHEIGFCGKVDHEKAAKWSERLANRGDTSSQWQSANHYILGRGVNKDLVKGLMWLNIASYFGKDVRQRLSVVKKRHSPSQIQIESAKKIASAWIKGFDVRIKKPFGHYTYGIYLSGKVTGIRGNNVIEVYGKMIRLHGVSVPPLERKAGKEAEKYLKDQIMGERAECLVGDDTNTNGKVGRCSLNDSFGIVDITKLLIKKGLARDCTKESGGYYLSYETEDSRTLPLPKSCR